MGVEYRVAWWKIALGMFITAFLLWHPSTRVLIWHILPIGAKPDDLIFLALALCGMGIIVLTIRGMVQRNFVFNLFATLFLKEKRKNEDNPFN